MAHETQRSAKGRCLWFSLDILDAVWFSRGAFQGPFLPMICPVLSEARQTPGPWAERVFLPSAHFSTNVESRIEIIPSSMERHSIRIFLEPGGTFTVAKISCAASIDRFEEADSRAHNSCGPPFIVNDIRRHLAMKPLGAP